jgi:hypothetical protein
MERKKEDLLIRIDERTHNIWRSVEEIKAHQIEQNGLIRKTCQNVDRNTIWRKVIIGVGTTIFIIIIGWLFYLSGIG